jgi:hypothetical protein
MVAKVIEDGKSWMVKRETQKEIMKLYRLRLLRVPVYHVWSTSTYCTWCTKFLWCKNH